MGVFPFFYPLLCFFQGLPNPSPLREPNSLKKQESPWLWQFLGDWGFKTVGERCCQDIPSSYQSHWSFLSLSYAFLLMTIFLPKIGICYLTRIFEVWAVLKVWILVVPSSPSPSVAHYTPCVLQLSVPLFPCLPGLIEGKLEKAQSPYTSFLP